MSAKEANTYFKQIDPSKIFILMATYLEELGDALASNTERGETSLLKDWTEEEKTSLKNALATTLDLKPEQISSTYIIKDAHIALALAGQMWDLVNQTKPPEQNENPVSQ